MLNDYRPRQLVLRRATLSTVAKMFAPVAPSELECAPHSIHLSDIPYLFVPYTASLERLAIATPIQSQSPCLPEQTVIGPSRQFCCARAVILLYIQFGWKLDTWMLSSYDDRKWQILIVI